MHDRQVEEARGSSRPDAPVGAVPPFAPEIDIEDVFRTLIEDELRNGRLTPARRKRIIRYAAQLRMSAVQAGQLIEASRQKILDGGEATEQCHLLRLVEPRSTKVPLALKISVAVALAIILDVLLLKWIA